MDRTDDVTSRLQEGWRRPALRRLAGMAGMAALVVAPSTGFAQEMGLHFAQAGSQLDRAEADLRILYGCVSAKDFDPGLAQATIRELDGALAAAKRATDRAGALLSGAQQRFEPDVVKLRELIKAAEDQLRSLATDIEEQTSTGPTEDEEDTYMGRMDEVERAARAVRGGRSDWELLKTSTGWLGVDLVAARAHHRALGVRLKLKPYPYPPKPKGRRPGS